MQNYGFKHQTTVETFSVEFQSQLMMHLATSGQYSDALKIAKLSRFSDDSFDNTALLQHLLSVQDLPDLVRADALMAYASELQRLTDNSDGVAEVLNQAATIYDSMGRACGTLEVELGKARTNAGRVSVVELTDEIWSIKEQMQRTGYWAGAVQCLIAIFDVNVKWATSIPNHLVLKIEAEWQYIRERTRNTLTWATQTAMNITHWVADGSNFGRNLEIAETFLEEIATLDVPKVVAVTVRVLQSAYSRIGETEKADQCLARFRDSLPRSLVVLYGLGSFDEVVNNPACITDPDEELELLDKEIQQVHRIIMDTPDLYERGLEVQRLANIARIYVSQYEKRNHDQIARILDKLHSAIHAEIPLLRGSDAVNYQAKVLQSSALLLSVQADDTLHLDDKLALISESLNKEIQAIGLYESENLTLLVGTATAQVGLRKLMMWQLRQCPRESDDFEAAANALEKAQAILDSFATLEARQLNCSYLIQLWFNALKHPTVRLNSNEVEPRDQAIRWINEADRLCIVERNDLSALSRLRSVLAKQIPRIHDASQEIHQKAIAVYSGAGDFNSIWHWIQKSKARSISDTMALGIIPTSLKAKIDSDAELTCLVEEEKKLVLSVERSSSEEQRAARTKLEAHREMMRSKPLLSHMFELREGQPTSVQRLQALGEEAFRMTQKQVFYIDWIRFPPIDNFFMFVASNLGVTFFKLEFTPADAQHWKNEFFTLRRQSHVSNTGEPGRAQEWHPLEEHNSSALERLTQLVRPILDFAAAGDLLIFSPTGELHGIPLHAALIKENTALIEHNPVVYTSSMTTFDHCVARELDRKRHGSEISSSYLAVYEQPESGPWEKKHESERDKIYSTFRGIASKRPQSSIKIGGEVNRQSVAQAFTTDSMYFFGHTSGADSILDTGLILAPPAPSDPTTAPYTNALESQSMLTVSDMFNINIRTSILTLLACGSSKDAHKQGDEPLGIVSALLCAGASSVIGTMWKVQLLTACKVTRVLNSLLGKDKNTDIIDVATAVQETVKRLKNNDELTPYHWATIVLNGSWFISR
jgi:CHAT domain-containing protein/tetratricopeptide (TPR) repeat protein